MGNRNTLAGLFVGLLLSVPALASTPAPPPGGAVVAPDGSVAVSSSVCAQLVAHVPNAGVNYVPGVDVNGHPVAPADLPANTPPLTISIVLNADLRRRFHIPANTRLFRPEAEIGLITVQGNTVLFNGQPIGVEELSLLAAACRAHGFGPP
jgi:hypothetical protein